MRPPVPAWIHRFGQILAIPAFLLLPAARAQALICVEPSALTVREIHGTVMVVDRDGRPLQTLQGATVRILRQSQASWTVVAEVLTDDDGKFLFPKVRPGRYRIEAEANSADSLEKDTGFIRVRRLWFRHSDDLIASLPIRQVESCGGGFALQERRRSRHP